MILDIDVLTAFGFFANAIALLASMFNVIGSTKFIPISLNTPLEPNQFLDSSKRGHIYSSASIVDTATVVCSLDFHAIGPLAAYTT